jgi:alkylation response protein AidB-like acyl-CoA dehydrogenase
MGPLVDFGAPELKERWLPQLATGKGRLACLGLTEPGAGSDLAGRRAHLRRQQATTG